jgi:hypothetical protein
MKGALAVQYCPQLSCLYKSNGFFFVCHTILYQILKFCRVGCWIGKDIGENERDLFEVRSCFGLVRSCGSIPGIAEQRSCEGRLHGARRFSEIPENGRAV